MRYTIVLLCLFPISCAVGLSSNSEDGSIGISHPPELNVDGGVLIDDMWDSGFVYTDVMIRNNERIFPKLLFPRDYLPDPAPKQ